ncbi:hypothetical protein FCG40_04565 [Fimbriimonadia bacterium ATM]|nr:MAG: hypothetical protein EDM73_02140 [Armatimonadota bacterium]MBC6968704.1 hypothetical protein [Armatimonadota bacterium]MCE7898457.1 hypothetical protein [Armatimonadetes bacterium ATM1]MDL1928250.1 hypothetical protein [Fimbriimonadia bacterium ATM]RIJ98192.1 MAG: hypothetical protein DCC45_00005 [Armatimonadota bacterium]
MTTFEDLKELERTGHIQIGVRYECAIWYFTYSGRMKQVATASGVIWLIVAISILVVKGWVIGVIAVLAAITGFLATPIVLARPLRHWACMKLRIDALSSETMFDGLYDTSDVNIFDKRQQRVISSPANWREELDAETP